ncbi:DgyrCDS13950 [Dimorphilus gyrociliatus]|uniref:DgyrCDS13950 n=1 Tax=Dimorphilus gyrociliatus TaxID=2664684 RepID=A0A7I8WCB1_9ANNE|nr:DgyrCDS13950 [Dimorphilus gyrociliatus]
MHSDRSAPEIGSLSCSNSLRKTHSTPQSNAVKAASSPAVNSRKKESMEDVVTKEIERKLSASPKSKKTFFDGFRASFRPRRSPEDDHNSLTLSVPQDGETKLSWTEALKLKRPSFRREKKSNFILEHPPKPTNKPESIYEVAPVFSPHLQDVTAEEGSTAVFTCRVCGRPRPNLMWFGTDQQVLEDSENLKINIEDDGEATLSIFNVKSNHMGQYSCTATNSVGSFTSTANLIIQNEFSAPEIKEYKISLKNDVWSVGALTFTLIYGHWEKKGEDLGVSEYCRDFWTKCLQLDPMNRPSTAECLQHSWIKSKPETYLKTILPKKKIIEFLEKKSKNSRKS